MPFNYSTQAPRIYTSARNMIASHIIAADCYAPGNIVSKWNPGTSTTPGYNGLYMRHFKAPNYLFGDGHAEWSDQYHKVKYRPGTTQVSLVNAVIWQHIQDDGSVTPPQY